MTETMTPKELMELARECRQAVTDDEMHQVLDQAAAALRSYAELAAALEWLQVNYVVRATEEVVERYRLNDCLSAGQCVSIARELGWRGLEEP